MSLDADTAHEVFDWLDLHEGNVVGVEVGTSHPGHDRHVTAPVKFRATLGPRHDKEDPDLDELVMMVELPGLDGGRLYVSPQRITKAIVTHASLWLSYHDSMHVALLDVNA